MTGFLSGHLLCFLFPVMVSTAAANALFTDIIFKKLTSFTAFSDANDLGF